MVVSRDWRVKVEAGVVYERINSGSWTEIGTTVWPVGSFLMFVPNDRSRVNPPKL
jgi:hypothetical protein